MGYYEDISGAIHDPYEQSRQMASGLDTVAASVTALTATVGGYVEATFSATFDHSVGAKTVVVRKIGKLVTLEIPLAAIADGLGTVVASGATDITAAYRPAADLTFPAIVTDNAVLAVGSLKVSAAGALTFSKATGAGLTNAAAAGFNRIAVTYSVA